MSNFKELFKLDLLHLPTRIGYTFNIFEHNVEDTVFIKKKIKHTFKVTIIWNKYSPLILN